MDYLGNLARTSGLTPQQPEDETQPDPNRKESSSLSIWIPTNDRLHSFFTPKLLIALAVLVSFKQFGGKPIECLTPDTFSEAWEQYAENYCWAQNTYFVPPQQPVEQVNEGGRNGVGRVSYYQWVPFFLLFAALCFRLPSLLWKYLSGKSGIQLGEVIKLGTDANNVKPDTRRANIRSITTHMQGFLHYHRKRKARSKRLLSPNFPYSAYYVSVVYLMTKCAYLINSLLQLHMLNCFLGTSHRYGMYGSGALLDLLSGTEWAQSGMFPRVTLCDFQVRVMGNIQQHTIQCVLVINLFNEKLFVLLSFWYAVLSLLTAGSLLYWLTVLALSLPNRKFIERHLEMSDMPFDAEKQRPAVEYFINNYLHSDGILVVHMLTQQAGVIFGTELVASLWQSYQARVNAETLTLTLTGNDNFAKSGGEHWGSGQRDSESPTTSAMMTRGARLSRARA